MPKKLTFQPNRTKKRPRPTEAQHQSFVEAMNQKAHVSQS